MTEGRPDFEGRAKSIVAEEQRRERAAQLASQALSQKIARANAIKAERDKTYQGTPPSEVFSADEVRLCKAFLQFAKARSFRGSTPIRAKDVQVPELSELPEEKISLWKRLTWSSEELRDLEYERQWKNRVVTRFESRGYEIGSTLSSFVHAKGVADKFGEKTSEEVPLGPRIDRHQEVYLCEDGMLRRDDGSSLPLDDQGEIIVPVVGNFVIWNVGGHGAGQDKGDSSYAGYNYANVTYLSLEDKLTQLAVEIERLS